VCGIIGVIGSDQAAPHIIDGLRRLEYRGYDSAGLATLANGTIELRRAEGKLTELENLIRVQPVKGVVGIGHTRWATHGAPTETNAHPHAAGRVAVVHNGIIENFQELRTELEAAGRELATDTDTEVVPHLIDSYMEQGLGPEAATAKALKRLEGAFALAIIFKGHKDLLIAARRGSPLAIGHAPEGAYLASDALALAPFTRRISYLEEGDWAVLKIGNVSIFDADDQPVQRALSLTAHDGAMIGKGNFRHYMLKEIYEQPSVIGDTLNTYYNPAAQSIRLPALPFSLSTIDKVTIVACGTSYYAGLASRYWIEQIARVPVEIDVASEFRYRTPPLDPGGMALFISQSGETADTLAAMRFAKSAGLSTAAVVNVPESTMAREADIVLPTHAGVEIGVASTKAFTTQLVTLACFTIALARARGAIDQAEEARLANALAHVPSHASEVLNHDERIRELAETLREARTVLYIGRGTGYPVAMEGALKLKEISYIHAEGFAAGELKHGPIALIDKGVPVIVVAPPGPLFDKTASNLQETVARGAHVVFLSDAAGIEALGPMAKASIDLPAVDPFVAPILYTIPVQLIAYHVAVLKGTDVDQPRNLAKSVTVE
jgi:glucosamine--fructose-6-phosphate aminotransferase (isomerizing)